MANEARKRNGTCKSAASFRFFGGLEKLLVRQYGESPTTYYFKETPGIKDAIEAMGVPHTEVDVILVNGDSVGFHYLLQNHDDVQVYPVDANLPAGPVTYLSPEPLTPTTFILDVHLGKLARRLRLLGFDASYRNNFDDEEIMRLAVQEQRVILTRDLGILKCRQVEHGYLVRSDQADVQLGEVVRRYNLFDRIQLWRRCLACNGLMTKVAKSEVLHQLEPKTRLYFENFHRCSGCGRVYWQGSHYEKILLWIDEFMAMNLE